MFHTSGQTFSSILLKPIYNVFAKVGHRRVCHYANDAVRLGIPVISVGNITFGGTSKTPVAMHLAKAFSDAGRKPGLVYRGYKGRVDIEKLPPMIVSDGSQLFGDWKISGDESWLAAESSLLDDYHIPVAAGRDRVEASKSLIDRCDVDLIILDDGYQYSGLERDFDLVLIDSIAPFGSTTLANGILREPVSSLRRADAIFLTHTEVVDSARKASLTKKVRSVIAESVPIYPVKTEVKEIRDVATGKSISLDKLAAKHYIGFAGIGNHRSFNHTLEQLPGDFSGYIRFPDHHVYSDGDISRILNKAKAKKAELLLTTSKDAVRLQEITPNVDLGLAVVEIDVEIDDRDELFERMHRALEHNH